MVYGKRRVGCNWVIKWLYAAVFAAVAVGCGDDTPAGDGEFVGGDPDERTARRLLAPLSGSVSGSRQPVFSFTRGAERARRHLLRPRVRARAAVARTATTVRRSPTRRCRPGRSSGAWLARHQTTATWQLVIPARESGLTTTSATVPDYNGDGLADVAVGAPAAGTGSVPVFFGSFFGVSSAADVTLTGGDRFGRAIAAVGDVNGDGFVDLAVASGGDPGTVNIYDGGPAGPSMGNVPLPPGPVTAGFGTTMASAGDVNGDGYGDVDRRRAARSRRCSWAARRAMAATAAFTLAGAAGGDALIVQGPGDVNGDGAPDVFVGGVLYLGQRQRLHGADELHARRVRRRLRRRRRRRRPDGLRGEPGRPTRGRRRASTRAGPCSSRRASSCSRPPATSTATATRTWCRRSARSRASPNASASTSARRPRAATPAAARSRRCSSPATIARPAA